MLFIYTQTVAYKVLHILQNSTLKYYIDNNDKLWSGVKKLLVKPYNVDSYLLKLKCTAGSIEPWEKISPKVHINLLTSNQVFHT